MCKLALLFSLLISLFWGFFDFLCCSFKNYLLILSLELFFSSPQFSTFFKTKVCPCLWCFFLLILLFWGFFIFLLCSFENSFLIFFCRTLSVLPPICQIFSHKCMVFWLYFYFYNSLLTNVIYIDLFILFVNFGCPRVYSYTVCFGSTFTPVLSEFILRLKVKL